MHANLRQGNDLFEDVLRKSSRGREEEKAGKDQGSQNHVCNFYNSKKILERKKNSDIYMLRDILFRRQ